jgi:hypothetical protein
MVYQGSAVTSSVLFQSNEYVLKYWETLTNPSILGIIREEDRGGEGD